MTAFDLDGTICNAWWDAKTYPNVLKSWGNMDKCPECLYTVRRYLANAIPLILPINSSVIITARPEILRDVTEDWLCIERINFSVLYMSIEIARSVEERAITKSKIIKNLGIKRYVEDEEKIMIVLKNLCPSIEFFKPEEAVKIGLARY